MFFIGSVFVLLLSVLVGFYAIYDGCFSNNPEYMSNEFDFPTDEKAMCYKDAVSKCVERILKEPCEIVYVYSHDGYQLAGRYYHRNDKAPLVIFFHGYRSTSRRDGNGIFHYTENWNYNLLLVDQRAHGMSKGKTITFGILERQDCITWTNWAINRLGPDVNVILSGLSMGGATVLMAAGMKLPKQVKGIYADCPFSSPKAVIQKVMHDFKYPVPLCYPLVRLTAKWFGHFDLEKTTAEEGVKNTSVPILIIHGEGDVFVPCHMSKICKQAGGDMVELLLVKEAGHGMCQVMASKQYEETVYKFLCKVLGE